MKKSLTLPAITCARAVAQVKPARNGSKFSKRGLQDISITRTGRPIIRVQGGRLVKDASAPPAPLAHALVRSSLGGHIATVFGATGFLGRYIVHRLGMRSSLPFDTIHI